jgi:hypothetical protein
MFSCYRRASDNLYIRVKQTTLLYKEAPELPRQPWREPLAGSLGGFRLGLGETRNPRAVECGVSS